MVFQLDDVNQYLTIRPDKRIFLLLIPFDRGAGRRVGFQKFINCGHQSGTADNPAVSGIGITLDRLHLGHFPFGPDEPYLLRALLLIELKPALLRNLNRLIFIQERRAVVGRFRWEEHVERRSLISSRSTSFSR